MSRGRHGAASFSPMLNIHSILISIIISAKSKPKSARNGRNMCYDSSHKVLPFAELEIDSSSQRDFFLSQFMLF
jgi:hypothetical protein